MKKNILLLIAIFSLIALAGGIYLGYSYERSLSDFSNIIKLHRVENLREHLLRNIQKVEIGLYSQTTLHPESSAAIESNVIEIEKSINTCDTCHHSADVLERFDDLRQQIAQYKTAISKLGAARAGTSRLRNTRTDARSIGRALMEKVETMASGNSIKLHHGENVPEQLLLYIQKVEIALYSRRSTHPQSAAAIENHVVNVEKSINGCSDCHHSTNARARIDDLRRQIGQYKRAISKIVPKPARKSRLRRTSIDTHTIGESLISKVEIMVVRTSEKLREQTEVSLRKAHRMKIVMITLIAAGPLMMIVFAMVVIKGVTEPVKVLLQATRILKKGDLEHRIIGLKDEFGELATAFNDMAGVLQTTMRAIEEGQKRYRLLFETAADAIFILDAEGDQVGRILQANQAAAAMHGYSVEELASMKIQDLNTPEAAASANSRIERIGRGEWIKFEADHRRKDGAIFPVDVSAGLLETGGHKYILAMDRDITERKRAERELQRTERIRVSGELATGLAHEIKNPLAGIKVSMEALSEESYLTDEDRDVLNKVIGEIKRIEYLMQGLLNFTQPPKPQLLSTDVNSILEIVAGLVMKECSRCRSGERAIHLSSNLQKDLPEIMADPMQLKQIFMNLILNAVDAMPDGGTLSMRTGFDPDIQLVHIELSDSGHGIDSAAITKIFNPFFTTKAKGTGLGLSITKRLVEEHGGRIHIENNTSGGVMCSIRFPVRQSEGASTA